MSLSLTTSRSGPSAPAVRQLHAEISVSACLDCGTPLPARLLDLARSDLLLLTDRPLRFGTPLQLAIFSDLCSAVTQNRAIVHWCRPSAKGWQIGAFLTQTLPDRLTACEWSDLRGTLRYDCNWKAWIHWEGTGQLESVRILNYSISGLRLNSERAVPLRSVFSLFGSAGFRDRAVLQGQVHWCRSSEDVFELGCIIHGQRGRDLPKMFGNLNAVHVDSAEQVLCYARDSEETLRCEQSLDERFFPAGLSHQAVRRTIDEVAELLE